jgi:hypothetical protein
MSAECQRTAGKEGGLALLGHCLKQVYVDNGHEAEKVCRNVPKLMSHELSLSMSGSSDSSGVRHWKIETSSPLLSTPRRERQLSTSNYRQPTTSRTGKPRRLTAQRPAADSAR